MVKLIILVRSDLQMSPGKIGAQASHASIKAVDNIKDKNPAMYSKWIVHEKIILVKIKSLAKMENIVKKAHMAGISAGTFADSGFTEVDKGTITTAYVGPDDDNIIDKITKRLRLL